MVTMEEIAEKAGVSQSTVSRVINGHTSVNPEVRKKVLDLIKKLNYQPNATAQSLVRRQSYLIGIIIPDIANPYFAELLRILEKEVEQSGYNVIFCNTGGNIQKEKSDIAALRSRQVDGILMVPADAYSKHLKELREINIPIVIVTQDIKGFDSVSVSHFSGGEQLGKHFVNMGYKSIGFIGDKNDSKYLGFEKILSAFGLEVKDENYIKCTGWNQITTHEMNEDLVKMIERPDFSVDAVFAYNDITAFSAIVALNEHGYKIPENIAIAGFDNTFISSELKLTSVSQPMEEIGRIGFDILLKKIEEQKNKKKDNTEEQHILLEPRLIVRQSTSKLI